MAPRHACEMPWPSPKGSKPPMSNATQHPHDLVLSPEAVATLQQAGVLVATRDNGELAITPPDPTVPTLVLAYDSENHAGLIYRFEQSEEWYAGNSAAVLSTLIGFMTLGGGL